MFKKLTLARRIIFGFVAVIGMMGLATLAANYALNVSQRSLLDVTNIEAVKIRDVGRMVQSLVALQRDEKNFILSKTQIEMDGHEKHIAMDVELLTRLLSRTKDLVDTEGLDLLRKFEQQYTAFRYTQKNVIALSRENANIRARDLSQGAGREAYDIASTALNYIIRLNGIYAEQVSKNVLNSGDIIRLSARTVQDLLTISHAEKNIILSTTQDETDVTIAFIIKTRKDMRNRREQLRDLVDDEGKAILDDFSVVWTKYLDLSDKVREIGRLDVDTRTFKLLSNKGRDLVDQGKRYLARLTNKNDQDQSQLLSELGQSNSKVKLAAQINHNLTEIQRGEKNIIMASTQAEMDQFSVKLFEIRMSLEKRLEELSQIIFDEVRNQGNTDEQNLFVQQSLKRLDNFNIAYRTYRTLHEQVRSISRLNSNSRAFELSTGLGRTQFDAALGTLNSLVGKVDQDMQHRLISATDKHYEARSLAHIILAISTLFAIVVVYMIVNSLTTRASQLVDRVQQLADGRILEYEETTRGSAYHDELSKVDEALNSINNAYRQIIEITDKMAVGNLTSRLTPRSDSDTLIGAINQMAENSAEVGHIANTIARGDLSTQIIVKSDEDQLSIALKKMVINLREASEAKDLFLATMSHELRTPLNAIIGLSTVLVSDLEALSTAEKSEYLVTIHSSGQHLLQVIGDILDLSKLNAAARSLDQQPFNVSEVIAACHHTFSFACTTKGINLSVDNQLNEPCLVIGDVTALKQILFNLVGNAVKFTTQGTVSLTVAHHATRQPAPDLGISFIVSDTGPGIEPNAISQLFDAFTQEDPSITRSYGGSGLGLNIAQSLAQLMGGEITCTSSVGHGSKFEVFVSLTPQLKGTDQVTDDSMENFKLPPLKILQVDDVASNLLVGTAMLKPKGHTIDTASNGQEAVAMASNNDYDVILMDVRMPGMDGMVATGLIRNLLNKQRSKVPIVALSADADVRSQKTFIASGMDGTVAKPWRIEALEKEIKRVLA